MLSHVLMIGGSMPHIHNSLNDRTVQHTADIVRPLCNREGDIPDGSNSIGNKEHVRCRRRLTDKVTPEKTA